MGRLKAGGKVAPSFKDMLSTPRRIETLRPRDASVVLGGKNYIGLDFHAPACRITSGSTMPRLPPAMINGELFSLLRSVAVTVMAVDRLAVWTET